MGDLRDVDRGRPRRCAMDDLPVGAAAARRGAPRAAADAHARPRRAGEEHWVLLKADGGARRRRARSKRRSRSSRTSPRASALQLRSEFLARAATLLASSLDYQQTLQQRRRARRAAARRLVRRRPDRRGGRARAGRRRPRRSRASWSSPTRLRAYEPEHMQPDRGIGRVVATGEPMLYNEIPDELLRRRGRRRGAPAAAARGRDARGADRADDDPRPHDRRRSRSSAPNRVAPSTTATSSSPSRSPSAPRWPSRTRACTASARASRARCRTACCPKRCPQLPGWEIAALYRPAGQESEVGGDFYDFWEVGEDWLMMIGDVTGKGVRRRGGHVAGAPHRLDRLRIRPAPGAPARTRQRRAAAAPRAVGLHGAVPAHLGLAGDRGLRRAIRCRWLLERRAASGRSAATARCSARSPRAEWPEDSYRARPRRFARRDHRRRHRHASARTTSASASERLRALLPRGAPSTSPAAIRERVVAALERFQVGAQADDTALVAMRSRRPKSTGRRGRRERRRAGGEGLDGDRAAALHDRVAARGRRRARLTLVGELDIATDRRGWRQAVEALLARGRASVVVDLRPLSFLDSSGLRPFIVLADRAAERRAGACCSCARSSRCWRSSRSRAPRRTCRSSTSRRRVSEAADRRRGRGRAAASGARARHRRARARPARRVAEQLRSAGHRRLARRRRWCCSSPRSSRNAVRHSDARAGGAGSRSAASDHRPRRARSPSPTAARASRRARATPSASATATASTCVEKAATRWGVDAERRHDRLVRARPRGARSSERPGSGTGSSCRGARRASPAVMPTRWPRVHQPSSTTRRAASAISASVVSWRGIEAACTPHISPQRRTVSLPGESA